MPAKRDLGRNGVALAATALIAGCGGLPSLPSMPLSGDGSDVARANLVQTLALDPAATDPKPAPEGVVRRLDIDLLDRPVWAERAVLSIDASGRGWIETGLMVKGCWRDSERQDGAAPRQLEDLSARVDIAGLKACLATAGLTGAIVSEPIQTHDGPFAPLAASATPPAPEIAPPAVVHAETVLPRLRRVGPAPATLTQTAAEAPLNTALSPQASEDLSPKLSPHSNPVATSSTIEPTLLSPGSAEEELLGGDESTDASEAQGAAAPPRAAKTTPIATQAWAAPAGATEAPPRAVKPLPKPSRPVKAYEIGARDESLRQAAAAPIAGLPSLDELLSEEPVSVEDRGSVKVIRISK